MRMEDIIKSINNQGPILSYSDLSDRLNKMELSIFEKNLVVEYMADKSREEFYKSN